MGWQGQQEWKLFASKIKKPARNPRLACSIVADYCDDCFFNRFKNMFGHIADLTHKMLNIH